MHERKVVIVLDELDIQAGERAALDRDAEAALGFLRKILKPKIDAAVNRGHCRPVFEWDTGPSKVIVQPPPVQGE